MNLNNLTAKQGLFKELLIAVHGSERLVVAGQLMLGNLREVLLVLVIGFGTLLGSATI